MMTDTDEKDVTVNMATTREGEKDTKDIEKQPKVEDNENEHMPPPPPPDGGIFAWAQVLAGLVTSFCSWGVVNAFGAFQNYYETNLLKNKGPSDISWIGSIQGFMVMMLPVFLGRAFDAGYMRTIAVTGAIMLPFGLMMASISTEFYQVFLSQGLCVGIGSSCLFTVGVPTVAQYFKRNRAAALGVLATGSSLGGIIIPVMLQRLLPKVGFGWTTRIIGFMVLGIAIYPAVFLKSRVPPRKSGPLIDIETITNDPAFMFFTIGCMFSFIGLYVPIFYIESWSLKNDIKPVIEQNIVSILCAGSVFGRLLPNFMADKVGPLNMLIPCTGIAGILTFAWIGVKGNGGVVVFAVLYGFASGSFVSLPGAVVSSMTNDFSKLGTRLGMNYGFCSIGVLIGGPVAGALINRMDGEFLGAQIFGGIAGILSFSFLMVSRWWLVGLRPLAKV